MAANLKGRHFLKELTSHRPSSTTSEPAFTINNKRAGVRGRTLEGKNVALIFEKPSTRTRCAFTVACVDEGAHPEYLGKGDIQLGKKESVADTARVLGRMFDGIQLRGFAHATVETLAKHAGVPVWNGLTDAWHPTQLLADVMTVREQFGTLRGVGLAYVGDGRNNVANSLLIGCAMFGMDVRIVSPESLFPRAGWSNVPRPSPRRPGERSRSPRTSAGVRGSHWSTPMSGHRWARRPRSPSASPCSSPSR